MNCFNWFWHKRETSFTTNVLYILMSHVSHTLNACFCQHSGNEALQKLKLLHFPGSSLLLEILNQILIKTIYISTFENTSAQEYRTKRPQHHRNSMKLIWSFHPFPSDAVAVLQFSWIQDQKVMSHYVFEGKLKIAHKCLLYTLKFMAFRAMIWFCMLIITENTEEFNGSRSWDIAFFLKEHLIRRARD